ncbi:tetratricopeptide repeat protein [Rhodopseudomonas palustris]|uniref:O-linked N-acetylglucosamine transferase, SPINDLY family protein n=1 Tax=Rhodopseudomonas palustris TaxID=1076 RepID=UPI0020CD616C|nr:glycosyltransferase family 41 protein [Rhodopseudomonas palustris]MCP9625747.1 tetratricopeptide repeat protein [Rhodopseudomonas palustris]
MPPTKASATSSSHDKSYEPVLMLMRARVLHQGGQYDEAKSLYKKVLKKSPSNFQALHFLGLAEYQSGHYDAGIRSIKRALIEDPKSAQAHSDLGSVLNAARRYDESLIACDKAIALDPTLAFGHANRGNVLITLGRFDDALVSLDKALELLPTHADTWNDRGNALHKLGRYDEALVSYEKAIALDPQHDVACINRATTLKELKRFDEALASYDRALKIGKRPMEAGIARADLLLQMRNVEAALATCTALLKIEPSSVPALTVLGNCMATLGDADTATALHGRALALQPNYEPAISSRIFSMDFCSDADFQSQQAARASWWQHVGARLYKANAAPFANDRDPDRRLVVGYVSADFRQHSAAFSFRPILEHHDRSKVEVICYSGVVVPDMATKAFETIADKWRDSSQWTDARLADTIRADKVDILIDLSGHSAGNRLRVFARKPAPVQVTAWGHATGTGLPVIDYLFADPVAVPKEVRPFYAEAIYDLPSIVIIEPPPAGLHSPELPLDRNGYLTYGSLNRISKLSDAAIAVWARIMTGNPTSRLILKDHQIDDPAVRQTLLEKFAAQGIAADRITLLGSTSRQQHLQTLREIDLGLDPFPQAGGVSTWEALHMGVPVVSKLGNTVASRVGSAILSAAGLPEFIATDEDRYVAIALAPDHDKLRAIRRGLPAFIVERCGPVAYTRAVEDAYRTMWHRWCATPGDAKPALPGTR